VPIRLADPPIVDANVIDRQKPFIKFLASLLSNNCSSVSSPSSSSVVFSKPTRVLFIMKKNVFTQKLFYQKDLIFKCFRAMGLL